MTSGLLVDWLRAPRASAAVREAVIQALRREGTPHHHNPAPDGKHN